MKDETYLNIFLSPAELSYDIKKLIMTKFKIDYKTYEKRRYYPWRNIFK